MPADFLSRNWLEEIDIFTPDLPMLQQRDEFAHAVSEFLQKGALPANKRKAAYVAKLRHPAFSKTASYGAAFAGTTRPHALCW